MLVATAPASSYIVTRLALTAARSRGRAFIVNGSFTVAAQQYRYWSFHVGRRGSSISGRFRAEGGGGNDIEVYVLDADGFENFRNGHTANTYYNSGRVTVGTINGRLAEGDYFLIFSNTFSVVTNKAVTASIELH
jgi:hypothetical protein